VIKRSRVRLPVSALPGSLGQLSLPSSLGYASRVPAYFLVLRRNAFTCVGWQVTLYDPMWQATPRSSVVGIVSLRAIWYFIIFTFTRLNDVASGSIGMSHPDISVIIISARRYCDHASSFVCLFVALVVISRKVRGRLSLNLARMFHC